MSRPWVEEGHVTAVNRPFTFRSSGSRATARILTVVALGLTAAVASAAPRVSHLDDTAGTVRFRVDFDAPRWVSLTSGAASYRYPVWDDVSLTGAAGSPELPAAIVRVALPPAPGASARLDQDVRVSAEASGGGSESGVRFPPVPQEVPGEGGAKTAWRAEEGPDYRGPARPVAELLHVGIERGLRIATVAVHPVRWDPRTGAAEWMRTITVTVTSADAGRAARPGPAVDRASVTSWQRTLVNPEAAARDLAPLADPPPPAGGVPSEWFDDAAGWLKIEIDADGIYSLTRTDLAAAGVPVATLDPRTFRLFAGPLLPEVAWAGLGWTNLGWTHVYDRPGFSGGFDDAGSLNQVAIRVDGESDGIFDSGDRLTFYALGPDNFRDRFGLPGGTPEDYIENPYTGRTVYWLAWGGTFSQPVLRMEAVDASPLGGTPVTQATERVHSERNSIYAPSLYERGVRWETWFWDTLDTQSAGKRFFVSLPDLVAGTTVDAKIRLWGANIPTQFGSGDEFLHHVQVEVNGTVAGLFKWGGFAVDTALTRQDVDVSGLPSADPSEFIFRVPVVGTNPARFDQSYLAWIEVVYRRALSVPAAGAELPVDAGSAGRTLRFTVPSGNPLDVYDVTDSRHPRRLIGGVLRPSGAGVDSLDVAWDSASGGRVLVKAAAQVTAPAAMVLDDPPHPHPQDTAVRWLRDTTEPLDYVIIAFDDFASEGEILADWRRSHLPPFSPGRAGRVRVVRVSDVMDEFTYGMWDPAALRYFLEYAYRYYGLPTDDRLSYCLFLGDHTYDFRDVLGTGERDFVPSWEDNRSDLAEILTGGNVQYASDDPLARFDGPYDAIPDLYLGRIPAASVAEARGVIETKIRPAEESPVYGAWRARCFLVADDFCSGAFNEPDKDFVIQSEVLDGLLPAALDRKKLYLTDYGTDCSISTKPAATADFIAAWNEGASVVHYLGHGNEGFLAQERLIDLQDLPALNANAGRWPVFAATASRSGKFNVPGQDGITESLLLLSPGGALATSGSGSNHTGAISSRDLGLDYMAGLFPGGDAASPAAAGAAFMEAKRLDPVANEIFTFFGDPATVPPVPALAMTVAGPDSLRRGLPALVSTQVAGGAARNGTAEILAQGIHTIVLADTLITRRNGPTLFTGTVAVGADTASGGFVVPLNAAAGPDGRIRVYAWGADWDALGALDPVPVGGTADPSADTEGPTIAFETHPAAVAVGDLLTVTFQDPSGIRLTRVGAQGMDLAIESGGTEVLRLPLEDRFAYDEGSFMDGRATFPVPDLDNGNYTFRVLAYDNYNNLSTLSEAIAVQPATGTVRFTDVYTYPNPLKEEDTQVVVFTLDRSAEVTIRIYAVSGRLVRKGKLAATAGQNGYPWDGRDQAGDRVANGVYLVQLAAGGNGGSRYLERVVVLR